MKARIVLAGIVVLLMAIAAGAQTKISGTAKCDKPDPQYSIDVGDRANHAVGIDKASCTWTKPMEIAGSQSKEGYSVGSAEVSGNKSRDTGYHVSTMASGEKFYVRYQGTSTFKNDALQSQEGKFSFTGGTGKLKGIKGQGTYKGTAAADGSITYLVEGEYTLPK